MRARPTSQRGFTLVEMMIALLLFSFAIAGVLSVAVTMSNAFHEQRQASAVETSVRAPMDYLADAIRLASPGVPSGLVQNAYGLCTTGAIVVNDSTTAPDSIDIVYATGTSITSLVTPYTAGTQTTFDIVNDSSPTQASQIFPGDTLLLTNFDQGTLLTVVGNPTPSGPGTATVTVTASTCGAALNLPAGGYPIGSLVIRVMRARFSILPVDGVPSLMMDPDIEGPLQPEPLAENIEDMQIAVGVDSDGDNQLSAGEWAYSNATPGPGPAGALTPIRGIRITLVARTTNVLTAGEVAGVGDVSQRPAAEDRAIGPLDAFRRRFLTSTIEVRNLVGSP